MSAQASSFTLQRVPYTEFERRVKEVVALGGDYAFNLTIRPDYSAYECWLATDEKCGYAISPDAELSNVFSTEKGRGAKMLAHVDANYSGLKVNCYAGPLEGFYSRVFNQVSRAPSPGVNEPDDIWMKQKDKQPVAPAAVPAQPQP